MLKRRRVLTIGTFDVPHIGHAAFLRKCEQFGDEVIVGVNTDRFVQEYRGKTPVFSYSERRDLITELGYRVEGNDSAGRDLIVSLLPDVLVIGSDWARKDYYSQINMTQDLMDAYEITMVYVPYTPGISSTDLKARLA